MRVIKWAIVLYFAAYTAYVLTTAQLRAERRERERRGRFN